ncbi:YHS domain-containing protein [Geobacter sp. DSM 9736]|uniref:YHS domain-containing protein n=1 Tax=Geobacter sp. DSM 9736 TaxID=1277350 RepID=UPI000B5FB5A0|nr:YHS domain-containing protein [Geobacter sp. DSM 9736]SNB45373.1 YHS domain-containing protein [Geobacter sp. DSM 9736]
MDIARDPVCGELIDWRKANGILSYRGSFYYFCCYECLEKFRIAPARYAALGT